MKKRKAISEKAYHSEKDTILLKFMDVAKNGKLIASLIFIGVFASLIALMSNGKITGMVIGGINLDTSKNKRVLQPFSLDFPARAI